MSTEIRCPVHECVWSYDPNEKPLSYSEISAEGHRKLNNTVRNLLGGWIGVVIEETHRRTERVLREHLESHDVTEWLMTLDYYKNISS